jgi:NitT/TauT family transport system permease protein
VISPAAAGPGLGRRAGGAIGNRLRSWAPPAIVFFGALTLWQVLILVFGIKQFILPAPLAIAHAWLTYLPELWAAASYTFWEIVAGLALGSLAGIAAGIATARFVTVRESLLPFAIAANSIPIIAFAPIMNNWFGIDQQLSKAMIAAVICFFPVMINTVRGLTSVDAATLELMRSYAASDSQVFRWVRVPTALPFLFIALRVATTLATIGAVVGEYFGAPHSSLGQYIVRYSSFLNFERSWAAIVFACAIGIGLYLAVVALERLMMPWHGSLRQRES